MPKTNESAANGDCREEQTPLLGKKSQSYGNCDPGPPRRANTLAKSKTINVECLPETEPQGPALTPIEELTLKFDQYVGPYVGETWFNIAIISVTVFTTYFFSYFGAGLGVSLFLGFFIAKLYESSLGAAYSRKVRKIQDFLMIPELETDLESAGWINRFLDRFWVQFEPHLAKQISTEVEKAVAVHLPSFIPYVKFSNFTLGTKPPLVEGVKYYRRDESDIIIMDWKLSLCPHAHHPGIGITRPPTHPNFDPRVNLDVGVKLGPLDMKIPIKTSDFRFFANVRVKMRLMNSFPHIKTIDVSLLSLPELDARVCPFWFDITNFPGFWSLLNRQLRLNLGGIILAPKVFTLDVEGIMSGGLDSDSAVGVLQLTLSNARNLKNVELIGTIDPFVSIDIEGRKEIARSRTVDNTTEPNWDQTLTILLHNLTETLNLTVKDQNGVKKDYSLGACSLGLSSLLEEPQQDHCMPLLRQGKARGDITFRAAYFPVAEPIKNDDGTEEIIQSNSGVLRLFVRQVSGLEKQKKMIPFGFKDTVHVEVKLNGQPLTSTSPLPYSNNVVIESSTEHFIGSLSEAYFTVSLFTSGSMTASFSTTLSTILDRVANHEYWFDFTTGANPGNNTQNVRVNLDAKWAPVVMDPEAHASLPLPIGFVRVHVHQGKDIKTNELGGNLAPSVMVLMSNKVYGKTNPMESTNDPMWDAIFYVPVHRSKEVLRFEVKGPSTLKKSTTLGQIDVPIAELLGPQLPTHEGYEDGELREGWHSLKSRGQIQLSTQFFSIVPEALPAKKDAASANSSTGLQSTDAAPEAPAEPESEEPENSLDLTQYNSGLLRVTVVEARGVGGPRTKLYTGVYLNGDDHNAVLKTRVCKDTSTPAWGETGEAFVKEVDIDKLMVVVKESKDGDDKVVGSWVSSIQEIIAGMIEPRDDDELAWYKLDQGLGSIQLKFHFSPTLYQIHPIESVRNRGILQVKVMFAENLMAADKDGSSDPYISLSLNGGKKSKTEVRKNDLNPKFDQMFSFKVLDRINSSLTVEAFDWNQLQSHKALGSAQVSLEPLPVETQVVETVPLTGVSTGSVTLEFVFAPMYVFNEVSSRLLDAALLAGKPIDLVGGLAKGGFNLTKGAGKFAVGGATMLATGGGKLAGGAITSTGKLALGGAKLAGEGAKTVFGAPLKLASGGAGLARGLFGKKDASPTLAPPEVPNSSSSNASISSQTDVGIVRLTLVEAKDLKAADRNGYSDPYIKVQKENKVLYKTKVIKKTRNPVWEESFTLPALRSGESMELRLHIKDHNTFGENVDLGEYTLNPLAHITDLTTPASVDVWTKSGDLQNGGSGLLHFILNFTPNATSNDASLEQIVSSPTAVAMSNTQESDASDDRRAASNTKSSFFGSLRKKMTRS